MRKDGPGIDEGADGAQAESVGDADKARGGRQNGDTRGIGNAGLPTGSAALRPRILRSGGFSASGLGWMLAALCLVFALSMLLGRYPTTRLLSPKAFLEDEMARRLVLNLRLPRIIMAMLLGMAMGAAGTVFQTVFGNPLIEPGFLGVSQGAAFGASLAVIALGGHSATVQISAAVFAFLGLAGSWLLAKRMRFGGWILRLVLAGIAVSALLSAGVGTLKYLADPLKQLPEITFWTLGALTSVTWSQTVSAAPVIVLSLIVMFIMRWRLNLLSLDDTTSFSLGLSPARERTLLLTVAVAATSAAVSVAGIVGWIGLIVPHGARRIWGADTGKTLPAAMLMGGIFTILCDDLARTLLAGEIPLGVLTSFFGAAFFIALMASRSVKVHS